MSVLDHAINAASMKSWPVTRETNGDLNLEIPTQEGRSQVVHVTMGRDGDSDTAAFIWSKAGELTGAAFDPLTLLRLNTQLTYGRVAVRGNDLLVMHCLYDQDAQLSEVGKTLYWVARGADDIEQDAYGSHRDVF